jgi:eukaryotic translation initiation factor 2-alpha kinase 4
VASFDPSTLRSAGVELLRQLWLNDISAELAMDSRSPEDLQSKYRDNQHYWVVFIKQGSSLKVKSLGRKDAQDVDIPIPQLVGWLRAEMRDRDHREGNSDHTKLLRHQITPNDHEQDVRVLMAQAKLKKSNRHNIVEQAHMRAASLVHSLLDGPIAAIETTDHVMALIRETRLSDPDSWQKVSQSLPTTERKYIGEIHNLMKTLANQNKDTTRNAFIYNIRTDNCIYYDMGS